MRKATHRLVIDLRLHPVHEERDVLGCGQLDRLLVLDPVLPQVLKLRPARHGRTALSSALQVLRLYSKLNCKFNCRVLWLVSKGENSVQDLTCSQTVP